VFLLVGVLALVIAGVVWLYLHENRACPLWMRRWLAGLRLAVVLLLFVIYLRPSLVFRQTNELKSHIALVRDASLSFARHDLYTDDTTIRSLAEATQWTAEDISSGRYSRAEIAQRIVTRDVAWLAEVLEKGSLGVYDFSQSAASVAVLGGDDYAAEPQEPASNDSPQAPADPIALPPIQPSGRGTDIGGTLKQLLADSSRLAAIVLVSDGQHNGVDDPLELARQAGELGIPIFTVGVGNPARPRNLAVTDVFAPGTARPQEPFELETVLYAEDLPGQRIDVELVRHTVNPSGQLEDPQSLESRPVDLPEDGGRVRVAFERTERDAGTFAYSIRTRVIEGEANATDNTKTTDPVAVKDEKIKILLIAGAPTWEYQLVQRLLQRDSSIALSCWLQTMDQDRPQEGSAPISELPRTLAELGQYNVIMMFDPNPDEFDVEWVAALQQTLRRKGTGLLYAAGPQHSNLFLTLNRLQGMRDILPVRFGDEQFIETSTVLASTVVTRPGQMLVIDHQLDHPVMSFHGDPLENKKRWGEIPSIFWSFPALGAKPTAMVLLERGDQVNEVGNQPLLVAGRFGAANVLYMGFNGTWRWRRVGLQAQYFDRFWMQLVYFLVETRSLQGARRGVLDVDRSEYDLGQLVTFRARLVDERFEPLARDSVTVVVQPGEGAAQRVELQRLPGQLGEFEGSMVGQPVGTFEATVDIATGEDGGALPPVDPVTFRVRPPGVEEAAYWLDEQMLRDVARESGGEYFAAADLGKLPAALPLVTTSTEYRTPPQPLWDAASVLRYGTFGLIFGLLTLEWALRKKYRLL